MTINEFRKSVKSLLKPHNIKSSITMKSGWACVSLYNVASDIYNQLHDQIEAMAGYKNNSDPYTDYCEYKVDIDHAVSILICNYKG